MNGGTSFIAVTRGGFVDGACFTMSSETSAWIADMKQSGLVVVEVPRDVARRLIFEQLVLEKAPDVNASERPGRMIVGRRPDGVVEAAGWDYSGTRRDAREDWLERGLTLEFLTADEVAILAAIYPNHVFDTISPVGEVLSHGQALRLMAGF